MPEQGNGGKGLRVCGKRMIWTTNSYSNGNKTGRSRGLFLGFRVPGLPTSEKTLMTPALLPCKRLRAPHSHFLRPKAEIRRNDKQGLI